jgi:adenylate kinase family enzyme
MSLANKNVICLIGGPGVGKGTQSDLIKQNYDVGYMSAGDLLRKAAEEDSEFGRKLAEQLRLGEIVAQEVTFGLLKAEIESQDKPFYVIDGFPRKVEQAQAFCETIVQPKAVIFLDADDDILVTRLTGRRSSSGRADDNPESVKLRLNVFHDISYPVIDYFGDRVRKVNAARAPEEIFAEIKGILDQIIAASK